MRQLHDYRAFLTQFFRSHQTTGAVMPSSRALATALCRHVGADRPQQILEAGPGTGAVTGVLVERLRPDDELCIVELNPSFAAHLRSAFQERPAFRAAAPRCSLVEGAVQQLATDRHFDVIISSLPLNNFAPADVRSILETYARLLKPTGVLSFFEYMLVRDAKAVMSFGPERDRLRGVGDLISGALRQREFSREWIWQNVPPAWVHHLRY